MALRATSELTPALKDSVSRNSHDHKILLDQIDQRLSELRNLIQANAIAVTGLKAAQSSSSGTASGTKATGSAGMVGGGSGSTFAATLPVTVSGNADRAVLGVNTFVGDSGSGGKSGIVPAPAAGDAAAQKFLSADGNWEPNPAAPVYANTPFTSSIGMFTVPHGLGYSPSFASIAVTTDGITPFFQVGWQTALRWDATNFYLYAANGGVTGFVDSIK